VRPEEDMDKYSMEPGARRSASAAAVSTGEDGEKGQGE